MHMKVKHRLPRGFTTVDHRTEILEALLLGHFRGHQQQMPQQGLIAGCCTAETFNRLSRNHQHVNRSRRSDVSKGKAEVIAVDLIAGNLTVEDFPEDRVVRHGLRGGKAQ